MKLRVLARILAITIIVSCCQSVILAHSDDYAANLQGDTEKANEIPSNETISVEQELTYYSNLFLELACHYPNGFQDDFIDSGVEITRALSNKEKKPSAKLLSDAVEVYGKVSQSYTHIHLRYCASGIEFEGRQASLPLTVKLPRSVIFEIRNETNEPIELQTGKNEHKRTVKILPKRTRSIVKSILANEIINTLPLEFDVASWRSRREKVLLPVKVSLPAIIKGRVSDLVTGAISPARIFALSSYNQYSYDKKFIDNKTLSEKLITNLLPLKVLPYRLPFFYSDGTFEVELPAGRTKITMERGFEHEVLIKELELKAGEVAQVDFLSDRIVDMKKLGWISGDTHIHWVKNHWSENEDIKLLAMVQKAEDIRVVNNLTLMHRTADIAFIAPSHGLMGPMSGYCDDEYHIQMAEEYRNDELYGHLCFLNIKRLILPISTGKGVAGPDAPDYPINKTAIENCRSQGGISVEAHGLGLNWDVPVNVINGLSDSLDQMPPQDYYRFLDCGFRIPLTNGSDHPARVAGCARAYVKVDGEFSYEKWIDGIRKCRTFTTSGPLIFLTVNNKDIGSKLDVRLGDSIEVKAKVISRYPIGNFQIVSNSEVVAEKNTNEKIAELTFSLKADQPRWFVARCSESQEFAAIVTNNIAHTSAIYVDLDGKAVFKKDAAKFWAKRMHEHAQDISDKGAFDFDWQRDEAVGYIEDGAKLFEEMIRKNKDDFNTENSLLNLEIK